MASLADQFCPNVHDAAITAACHDPVSGTVATADALGVVAVKRPGESTPGLVFRPGGPVTGALALIPGGSWIAVGDDMGSVGVYRTSDGTPVFQELREGPAGRVRAMRGVAVSPEGSVLAAIAIDGLVRLWDIPNVERIIAWKGFGGQTVEFDARGDRLLCLSDDGQPRLVDLRTRESLPMDRIQMAADHACFTRDNTMVLCAGPAGLSLIRVVDGVLAGSFATRGGSGIIGLALSPKGEQTAVVTQRSVHIFNLPDLSPASSRQHGAPDPSGSAIWTHHDLEVAGSDGMMHGSEEAQGIAPVVAVAGFGSHRIAAHDDLLAVWKGDHRVVTYSAGATLRHMVLDREGHYLVTVPERGPITVIRASDGSPVFDGGHETYGAVDVAVGGNIVAVQLRAGGVRWWDLASNRAFELAWAQGMALSGSGTWLGVITPKGAVRILDPSTGKDAVDPPTPLADVPVVRMSFVNRRPDLLVIDRDGVLGHYDLAQGIRAGRAAEGRDILDFEVQVDRVWGITGGRFAAVRLPEGDRCTIVGVDLERTSVVSEIEGLNARSWVDPETGMVLEPARSGAILERDLTGKEVRVLRSLPGREWVAYGERGILAASDGAGIAMGLG
jgi:WD40 repeat protein